MENEQGKRTIEKMTEGEISPHVTLRIQWFTFYSIVTTENREDDSLSSFGWFLLFVCQNVRDLLHNSCNIITETLVQKRERGVNSHQSLINSSMIRCLAHMIVSNGFEASVLLNFERQFNAKISECTTVRAGMLSKDTPRCISVITPLKCIFDLDSRHRVNNFPRFSIATDFVKQLWKETWIVTLSRSW